MEFNGYRYNKAFGAFCARWQEGGELEQALGSALEYLTFYLVEMHQGCVMTRVQLLPVSKRYIVRICDYYSRELPDGTPCQFPQGAMVHHEAQEIPVSMKDWMVQLITDHEAEFVPSYMLEH